MQSDTVLAMLLIASLEIVLVTIYGLSPVIIVLLSASVLLAGGYLLYRRDVCRTVQRFHAPSHS